MAKGFEIPANASPACAGHAALLSSGGKGRGGVILCLFIQKRGKADSSVIEKKYSVTQGCDVCWRSLILYISSRIKCRDNGIITEIR